MLRAGTTVEGGYYFNRDQLDLVAVAGKAGTLPGAEGQRYYRVPTLAVLLLAPALGALFVVLLPLIALLVVLRPLGRPTLVGAKRASRSLRLLVDPIWRRGEAYFAGKQGEQRAAADAEEKKPKVDPDAP